MLFEVLSTFADKNIQEKLLIQLASCAGTVFPKKELKKIAETLNAAAKRISPQCAAKVKSELKASLKA